MFRQVKTELPRAMLGWETGTLEVQGAIRLEPTPEFAKGFSTKKLVISTTDEHQKVPAAAATIENGCVTWTITSSSSSSSSAPSSSSSTASADTANTDNDPPKIRLPVYGRYASAAIFEIGGGGGVGNLVGAGDAEYVAALWLRDVPDDEATTVRVPVLRPGKGCSVKQLRQNYSACEETLCVRTLLTYGLLDFGLW